MSAGSRMLRFLVTRPALSVAILTVLAVLGFLVLGLSKSSGAGAAFLIANVLLLPATLLDIGLQQLPMLHNADWLIIPCVAFQLLGYVWCDGGMQLRARRTAAHV